MRFKPFKAALLSALTCVGLVHAPLARSIDYPLPETWTRYMSVQGSEASWADTVRGLGAGGSHRTNLTAALQASEARTRLGGRALDLINPVGWIASGRDAAAVRRTIAGMDATGIDASAPGVTREVREFQSRYTAGTVYWQVGNEINSAEMTANLLAAKGIVETDVAADDARTIAIYAEYVFAPTVEAIHRASREWSGDDRRIKIVLGSIAGARRATARAWLDGLLRYRLRGSFAPGVAGKRVAELVSIVAVHYPITADRSVDGSAWRRDYLDLRLRWVGNGFIEGIWNTEELGERRAESGFGAATAVRVAAACLSNAARRRLTPVQSRVSMYGWDLGPADRSGRAGMSLLQAGLGQGAVKEVTDRLALSARGSLQRYAFIGRGKTPLTVITNNGDQAAFVDAFSLPLAGGTISGQGTRLTSAGVQSIPFRTVVQNGRAVHVPATPVRLEPGETLIVR